MNLDIKHLSPKKRDQLGTLSVYCATLLWGSTFLFQKILLNAGIPVFYMIGIRFFSIIVLFGKIKPYKIAFNTWKKGICMGLILFVAFSLQTVGLIDIEVSVSAFLTGLTVIFVPLINSIVFRSKLSMNHIIAVILALLGVYFFNITPHSHFAWNRGSFLTVLCAFFFGTHIVVSSYFLQDSSSLELTLVQNITCSIMGFFIALLTSEHLPTITISAVFALLYLGLIGSLFCYFLQAFGQKLIKNIVKVGIILAFEPIFATFFAIVFGGEILTSNKIIGMIIIVSSVILCEWNGTKKSL